jgi:hypothetical protein
MSMTLRKMLAAQAAWCFSDRNFQNKMTEGINQKIFLGGKMLS